RVVMIPVVIPSLWVYAMEHSGSAAAMVVVTRLVMALRSLTFRVTAAAYCAARVAASRMPRFFSSSTTLSAGRAMLRLRFTPNVLSGSGRMVGVVGMV